VCERIGRICEFINHGIVLYLRLDSRGDNLWCPPSAVVLDCIDQYVGWTVPNRQDFPDSNPICLTTTTTLDERKSVSPSRYAPSLTLLTSPQDQLY
jgi:hypothetical protein